MNESERDLSRLGHMKEWADKILFLVHKLSEFENFETNWVEQDAMIRDFEIIGEASHHISESTKKQYSKIAWHKIRGMRNFMTHEYFGIRLQTIWETAVVDIPILRKQILQVIDYLENTGRSTSNLSEQ